MDSENDGFPKTPVTKLLKFPNARLLIHSLIAERKMSGQDALAVGACELGLMSAVDMETVHGQAAAQSDLCGCSQTAKLILKKYFDKNDSCPTDAFERCWENVQERSSKRLSGAACSGSCNSEAQDKPSCSLCSQHAPVIFDYLLQEVHRYP
ncbi:MAG TPA: hypothetical protein V6C89_11580 [Drouetiella sp.]|jgi:hypothetical protein